MKTKLFFILGIIFLCGCGPNIKNPESVTSYLNGKTYYRITTDLSICEVIEFKNNNTCLITQTSILYAYIPFIEKTTFTICSIDPNSIIGPLAEKFVGIKFNNTFESLLINSDGNIISVTGKGGVFNKTKKTPAEILKEYKISLGNPLTGLIYNP